MVNVRVIIPFFHGGISRCIYSFQLGFVVSILGNENLEYHTAILEYFYIKE